jgi:hypothetical protein
MAKSISIKIHEEWAWGLEHKLNYEKMRCTCKFGYASFSLLKTCRKKRREG